MCNVEYCIEEWIPDSSSLDIYHHVFSTSTVWRRVIDAEKERKKRKKDDIRKRKPINKNTTIYIISITVRTVNH